MDRKHEHGECRSEPAPVMGEGSEGVARARGGAPMVPPEAEAAAVFCRVLGAEGGTMRAPGSVTKSPGG